MTITIDLERIALDAWENGLRQTVYGKLPNTKDRGNVRWVRWAWHI